MKRGGIDTGLTSAVKLLGDCSDWRREECAIAAITNWLRSRIDISYALKE